MSVVYQSRKFTCAYCAKLKKGAYTFVDGNRSCEKCNREYNMKEKIEYASCPLCKGKGNLKILIRRGSYVLPKS